MDYDESTATFTGPGEVRPAPQSEHAGAQSLLVSACLVGICTRFDGGARRDRSVLALAERFVLVPVCPEQLGGLSTPRPPAELQGGGGEDVLAGRARVRTLEAEDVTDCYVRGARATAAIGRLVDARGAVLKARSPSCGVGETYDGSFQHRLRPGSGVTAALLLQEGYRLWTEEDIASMEDPAGLIAAAHGREKAEEGEAE